MNEIDKVLGTCKPHFDEVYDLYLETLGKVYGFNTVSEYLLFEGAPSLSLQDGIKACYICDEHQKAAPWDAYMEYFKPGVELKDGEFKYFIRGLLVLGNDKRLNRMAKILAKDPEDPYCEVLRLEFRTYHNQEQIQRLSNAYPKIQKIIQFSHAVAPGQDRNEVLKLAQEILAFDNVYTKEADTIARFISIYRENLSDPTLADELTAIFKGQNWFYNWLIYYITILKLDCNSPYSLIKDAFNYLSYNTKPFWGKPRTCDLYSLPENFKRVTVVMIIVFYKKLG